MSAANRALREGRRGENGVRGSENIAHSRHTPILYPLTGLLVYRIGLLVRYPSDIDYPSKLPTPYRVYSNLFAHAVCPSTSKYYFSSIRTRLIIFAEIVARLVERFYGCGKYLNVLIGRPTCGRPNGYIHISIHIVSGTFSPFKKVRTYYLPIIGLLVEKLVILCIWKRDYKLTKVIRLLLLIVVFERVGGHYIHPLNCTIQTVEIVIKRTYKKHWFLREQFYFFLFFRKKN